MAMPLDFLGEVCKVVSLQGPATVTATTNGSGVDRTGYEHMVAILDIGGVSGTPTFDVKVQDSADNSAFADYVPEITGIQNAAGTTAAFPQKTANGISHLDVDLRGARKYIRAVITVGGGTPSGDLAVCALLMQAIGASPELSS